MRWRKYWMLGALLAALLGASISAFYAYQASRTAAVTGMRQALWVAAQAKAEFQDLQIALERLARTGSAQDVEDVHTWFDVFWGRLTILHESRGAAVLAELPHYRETIDGMQKAMIAADPVIQRLQPGDLAAAHAALAAVAPIAPQVQDIFTGANTATDLADVRQTIRARDTYVILLTGVSALLAIGVLLIALQFRDIRMQDRLLAEHAVAIADLRQREAELEAASRRASDANDAKTFFLANMSHELRTPLNAILGFSEMIGRETFGPLGQPKYREYADDIHRSAGHLLELINDILGLTRVEAGKLQIEAQPVDLAEIWQFAAGMLRDKIDEALLRLDIRLPRDLPSLRGDTRALRQVAINLISNAIKFTPAGGTITVAAETTDDGLVMSVADTGVGLTPDEIRRVFQPYVQVRDPMIRRNDGIGLGLALVRALVELHDGTAAIESEKARGTRVILKFPAARIVAQPVPEDVPGPLPI